MDSMLIVVLVGVCVICGALPAAVEPRPWCYDRIQHYTRVLDIRERVCRTVFVPSRGSPDHKTVGNLQNKPAAIPRKISKVIRQDQVTAKQVMGMFPGLFLNKTTVRELNTKLNKCVDIQGPDEKKLIVGGTIDPSGQRRFKGGRSHDGDLHCPTYRNLNQAPNTMENIQKKTKEVVHFPTEGVFQYINKGTCGSASTLSCNGGGCFQEKSIMYLMVWTDSPDWPTGFDHFEVESYCSCKSITI